MDKIKLFETAEALSKQHCDPIIQSSKYYQEIINNLCLNTHQLFKFNTEIYKVSQQLANNFSLQMEAIKPAISIMQSFKCIQLDEFIQMNTTIRIATQQLLGSINTNKINKLLEYINQIQPENESIEDIVDEISNNYTDEELQILQDNYFMIINDFNDYIVTYMKTLASVATEEQKMELLGILKEIIELDTENDSTVKVIFCVIFIIHFLETVANITDNKMLADDNEKIAS